MVENTEWKQIIPFQITIIPELQLDLARITYSTSFQRSAALFQTIIQEMFHCNSQLLSRHNGACITLDLYVSRKIQHLIRQRKLTSFFKQLINTLFNDSIRTSAIETGRAQFQWMKKEGEKNSTN